MSVHKQFSKDLYARCDDLARQATTEYLKAKGLHVKPHSNPYAQDLVAANPAGTWCVECEVKLVWSGDTFPFDSVQLPERKRKFFNTKTQFFIWNKELTKAATFWSTDVEKLAPVEIPNKYVARGECFYQIPLDLVEFITHGSI